MAGTTDFAEDNNYSKEERREGDSVQAPIENSYTPRLLREDSDYQFGCWQEDGGSVLPTRFMAAAEQRHAVPKLSRSVFEVFVYQVKQVYAGNPKIRG